MRELDWFDGPEQEEPAAHTRSRRRLLPVLAALPWLVVAAMLALPLTDSTDSVDSTDSPGPPEAQDGAPSDAAAAPLPADTDAPGDDPAHDGDTAAPAPDTLAGATTDRDAAAPAPDTLDGAQGEHQAAATLLTLEELRGRWRVAPGTEELASLAIVVARAHLTGVGPPLEVDGAAPEATSYAEHLIIEAVEHPSADTAVVTVLALVLIDHTPEPTAVALRRLAVPLTIGDGAPAPAGPPWDLPAPAIPPAASVPLEPIEDADLLRAADAALALAGLGTQRATALATAPGWPFVATTTDVDGTERSVWLRRHLDGLVVSGSTLAGSPAEEEQQ